jgi:hypothetical protein
MEAGVRGSPGRNRAALMVGEVSPCGPARRRTARRPASLVRAMASGGALIPGV